jgi:hypothetical protein
MKKYIAKEDVDKAHIEPHKQPKDHKQYVEKTEKEVR